MGFQVGTKHQTEMRHTPGGFKEFFKPFVWICLTHCHTYFA